MKETSKKWVIIGAIAVGVLAFSNRKKLVDIAKSMARTFKNEGNWYAEPKGGSKDTGDYYGGVFYGTNWGVTAAFLAEPMNYKHLKIDLHPSVIKDLTKEKATWIFEVTEGARMRYNDMTNQAVADFIFDWIIQRPATCVYYMTEKIFGMPAGSGTKAGVFSDMLVKKINGSDPEGLYNALKFWRLHHLTYTNTYKSFRKGVFNRIVSFKDFSDTAAVTDMIEKARKVAFG
jgi:lysozyme family protein